MDDPVKLHRETVKIEGGRNLYNYTFEVESDAGDEDGEDAKASENREGNLKKPPEETE